ncbi:hypothetical protein CB0940_06137 [Cercospora beticola]|uniref:Uncharacterized protein n=1 Tax=Cercospora beticola TaxID=122368 RepID=A0A2G5I014_CERBT|nr:hypothetical protein CB0940_06137 [Cercospora beticola]PIA98129.1 hypothetical protein CB0940_06137 [Cercospora beticola]WPA98752.1 hypothetical protein RHO25_003365 [Cercospora beticola]
MPSSKLSIAAFVGLASAAIPFGVPSKRQISLPPLIPAIPGVTEPISENAPPRPILQLPTPPLPSPPWEGSNIKPKKIGYFWTGAGDNKHADFLASYSLDDDTFGTLLRVVDVPTSGNSPHHLGVSKDGQTIWGGGLLSLLKTQDTGYYFDVSNPYEPKYQKSDRALLASIADEIVAKPDGGFFITYMGSAVGTSPGRLIETDAEYNIIHQWPEDVEGTLNILGEQFSPHGLSIDFERNVMLTSDFVVPITVLKPSLDIQRANTLRLWDLANRKITNTITIPDGGGIQDVKFIPGNPDSAAIATAVHLGQVWIIYPFQEDENGKPGRVELLYDLGPKARDTTAIYSDITKDGKYAYFTLTTANHIAALDISDLNNVKRLDDPDEDQPTLGPHYLKLTPDQKHLVVTDYFVETGDIGILNTPGDYKALYIDIEDNGALNFNRSIDFPREFYNRGGAKPHSAVVFDLTDEANPICY